MAEGTDAEVMAQRDPAPRVVDAGFPAAAAAELACAALPVAGWGRWRALEGLEPAAFTAANAPGSNRSRELPAASPERSTSVRSFFGRAGLVSGRLLAAPLLDPEGLV